MGSLLPCIIGFDAKSNYRIPPGDGRDKNCVLSRRKLAQYWPTSVLILASRDKKIYQWAGKLGIGLGKILNFLKIMLAKVGKLLQEIDWLGLVNSYGTKIVRTNREHTDDKIYPREKRKEKRRKRKKRKTLQLTSARVNFLEISGKYSLKILKRRIKDVIDRRSLHIVFDNG